ncbi:hypothetical protein DNTS_024865 [Danionella cerebrum]|uniref:Retinol dehydrogenase 1 n=1 Tax=Danionella cerebrum TaxID=2873325 RepID=A0A553QS42_9TELE|nr:hypothetical protein DNTS_024865 [Danionella translucida]
MKDMFLYIFALIVLYYVFRWFRELARVPDKSERYVYITGCDTGFGNLLTRHLDVLGFRVIAGCFTERGEQELKNICSERLTALRLDVTNSESVENAANIIKSLVGGRGLWAVVNNAGISFPTAPNDWLNINDFRPMLEVNLMGVIAVTLSILPLIKKAKGRVVNVASVFGRISTFGGAYCISKYGVEAFNDSLRRGMAPFGVKVLCIEPGFFRTAVTDYNVAQTNFNRLWERLPQETKDEYGNDFIDKAAQVMKEKIDKIVDSDLMKVVRCMEHAVAAVHPRTRYSPGWDAKLFWLPLSYMPSFISDAFIIKNTVKPKVSVLYVKLVAMVKSLVAMDGKTFGICALQSVCAAPFSAAAATLTTPPVMEGLSCCDCCWWCFLVIIAIFVAAWFYRDSCQITGVNEKYVLITGCDSGFGNLAARQLDRRGFHVIAACLTETGAEKLQSTTSDRCQTILLNVTDSSSINRAVDHVRRVTGDRGLWGLVNNAGISVPIGPIEWMQMEDFRKVLDVNLMGVIDVTLQFLPLLKKARGRLVNVASILGRLSIIGGGYCLAKFGVEAFSDSLRRELVHFGVKVSIIEPGFFKTQVTDLGIIEGDLKKRWRNLPEDVIKAYGDSYLENYLKLQVFSSDILASSDLSKVTSCMQHALSACHPRSRYATGWDAKFLWIPLSYLPTCVVDILTNSMLPPARSS